MPATNRKKRVQTEMFPLGSDTTVPTAPVAPALTPEATELVVLPSPAQSFMSTLDRILESDVSVEKWKLAMDMRRELIAEHQREVYFRARAAMAAELPEIPKVRPVPIGGRNFKYAPWEDMYKLIGPVLAKHGFFFSFPIEGQMLYAVLNHSAGHSEKAYRETGYERMPTRNSNEYWAWKSAVSYTKRGLAEGLLNIVTRGEDDEAVAAGFAKISDEQVQTIKGLMKQIKGLSTETFLATMLSGVTRVEDIPDIDFKRLVNTLNARIKRSKENADLQ